MRGGFLSSFSVPGAGMITRLDPNCPAGHGDGKGVVGVACALPQNKPAWNSWSEVSPLAVRATGPPSETGTAPATIFFFQAEDGIRDFHVTGVQTCALPI